MELGSINLRNIVKIEQPNFSEVTRITVISGNVYEVRQPLSEVVRYLARKNK